MVWPRSSCSGCPFPLLCCFLGDNVTCNTWEVFYILCGEKCMFITTGCSKSTFLSFDFENNKVTVEIARSFLHLSSHSYEAGKSASVVSTSSVPLCTTEFPHEISHCSPKWAFLSNHTRPKAPFLIFTFFFPLVANMLGRNTLGSIC